MLAMEAGSGDATMMGELRQRYGLDLPWFDQLLQYLYNLAHLDLGTSVRLNAPVLSLILERIPNTLMLVGAALVLALVIGISVGCLMSAFAGTWVDRVLSLLVLIAYSVPGFWLALLAIVLFSVKLDWLPSGGSETFGANYTGFAFVADRLRYLVMPAFSLALFYAAVYARLMRASMLEVRQQDYIRIARAKGLTKSRIQLRHAIPNALIPVTTMAGIHISGLLGGAMVVETVFSWPGMGLLAIEAMMARDSNVLLGILLFSSIIVILTNVAVDLLQAWIDPRIRI
jgi:peptide/nickel transport system permease protein